MFLAWGSAWRVGATVTGAPRLARAQVHPPASGKRHCASGSDSRLRRGSFMYLAWGSASRVDLGNLSPKGGARPSARTSRRCKAPLGSGLPTVDDSR